MASGPFDDLPAPLTQRERKVLAELEADLGEIRAGRVRWLRSVLRTLGIIVPIAGVAASASMATLAALTPPVAVAVTGLVCTTAAVLATALVITSR
jgi:hypothetical protein